MRKSSRSMIDALESRLLFAGLTAQYFDRVDFTNLKATQTDSTVNFNWPGAPVSGVGADGFAVRWSGQVQPQYSEVYTFFVASDDGARLWVDGRLLVDNWVNQSLTEQSAKVSLQAGQKYDIRLDYYDNTGGAQVSLSWSSASQAKQIIPSTQLFTAPAGLEATYFGNDDFTSPTVSEIDPAVDFDWGSGSPAASINVDHFSARWTGQIVPQFSQTYTFDVATDADATVKLRVDGQLVVDSTSVQDSGQIQLEAGKRYDIQLDYSEAVGPASVKLQWSSTSQPKQVIPNARLFATAATSIPTRISSYTNSVLDADRPDPGVIYADGYYWMTHTTGGPSTGWPLYKSTDMTSWTFVKNLLDSSNKPAWMTDSFWAPEIHKIGSNFVITGTAYSSTYGHLCIALGSSTEITGPYTVQSTPIVNDTRNVLDSDIFLDNDGRVYMVWKRDGPSDGTFGSIRIREMTSTASGFAQGSVETQILDNNFGGWEKNLAEAPWMIHRGQYYYLFYSGAFIDTSYAEGVARATSPTATFTRNPANPIITSNATWGGPGHGGFAQDVDGTVWFLYHARHQSNPDDGRVQVLDKVVWTADGWPTFGNGGTPSTTTQAGPHVQAASGAGKIVISGSTTSDDILLARSNPDASLLDITINRVTQSSLAFAETQSLTLNDGRNLGGNDRVILDFERGEVIPGAGLTLNNIDGGDTVRLIGADANDAFHVTSGRITHGSGIASFAAPGLLEFTQGNFSVDGDLQSATVRPAISIGATAHADFGATQHLGALTLVDGATARVVSGNSSILSTTALSLAPNAQLDLGDGALIIDYASGGTSPLATVESQIAQGLLTSTSFNADHAIGYAEASVVAPDGTFRSQTVDASAVIAAYTLRGDANLDGAVTTNDFTMLAANFGQSGATWQQGDFNNDGTVNALDFNAFANNFGKPLAANVPTQALSRQIPSLFGADPIKPASDADDPQVDMMSAA